MCTTCVEALLGCSNFGMCLGPSQISTPKPLTAYSTPQEFHAKLMKRLDSGEPMDLPALEKSEKHLDTRFNPKT